MTCPTTGCTVDATKLSLTGVQLGQAIIADMQHQTVDIHRWMTGPEFADFFALSRASLSFAYPFAALGYVIIVAASILFLDEHVAPLGWAGVACIVVGILLVAQGSPQG